MKLCEWKMPLSCKDFQDRSHSEMVCHGLPLGWTTSLSGSLLTTFPSLIGWKNETRLQVIKTAVRLEGFHLFQSLKYFCLDLQRSLHL